MSHAMRVISTRVLPLPAPARISAGSFGSVTAAYCSGFRLASSSGMEAAGRDRRKKRRAPHAATRCKPIIIRPRDERIGRPLIIDGFEFAIRDGFAARRSLDHGIAPSPQAFFGGFPTMTD